MYEGKDACKVDKAGQVRTRMPWFWLSEELWFLHSTNQKSKICLGTKLELNLAREQDARHSDLTRTKVNN
jgi:hypothetical protein